ncbi:MAG: precorrin-3B synthase [Defluviimonas sp.]|uniref:precorrin-3B synthase n=1 Tax=Albidovulum sp. TaxID=1872424 RepID=UPI001D395791|nr:precorrin-3B synthase [Paracoccaceae bacterium]MCC0064360.1 precorrin-3B synthase [Defluviimonas sp.]
MSAPVIQGWCPGALRPMISGDGLVVRVRARGGRLEPAQVRGIADLARKHGNGLIDLSARANVQLRGVTADSHAPLIEGLRKFGVIDISSEAEARRNIVVTPFWAAGDGTQEIAATLESRLSKPCAPATPGKFGYSIESAEVPVLRGVSSDIRIEWQSDGFLVRGEGFVTGARATTPADIAEAAVELAHWFVEQGGGGVDGRGRMSRLWPEKSAKAREDLLPARFKEGRAVSHGAANPLPGPCPQGFLVALAFGQTNADTFAALADLGPLRLTPWRMILIEGLARAPALSELITDPTDPLLNVVACTGAPGCVQALAPTRALARRLAPGLRDGTMLHVSGCAKGCAHPGAAPLTLVARGADHWDLIRAGTAAGHAARAGIPADALASDLFETE